ncbi:undecaprenyl-diphosphate phosphatase, partial [Candidatus Gribaldobacteria bacterium]|nr:undecaprenyl-diphosphate phosphatase [Candidatus Gribaldobacteria bacterium]
TAVSLLVAFPLYQIASKVILGGWLLFLTGFGLLLTAFLQKSKKIKEKSSFLFLSNKLALLAGFLQGFAVLPGVSRSGTTIFALSLSENKSPKDILKLSYLMSAPLVLASSFYLLLKGNLVFDFSSILALFFSFLVGLIFLKILLKLVEKINFFWFALLFACLCFLAGLIEFLL